MIMSQHTLIEILLQRTAHHDRLSGRDRLRHIKCRLCKRRRADRHLILRTFRLSIDQPDLIHLLNILRLLDHIRNRRKIDRLVKMCAQPFGIRPISGIHDSVQRSIDLSVQRAVRIDPAERPAILHNRHDRIQIDHPTPLIELGLPVSRRLPDPRKDLVLITCKTGINILAVLRICIGNSLLRQPDTGTRTRRNNSRPALDRPSDRAVFYAAGRPFIMCSHL